MIKELIDLANTLDAKGLRKEADYLDGLIKKMAGPEERGDSDFNFDNEVWRIQEKLSDEVYELMDKDLDAREVVALDDKLHSMLKKKLEDIARKLVIEKLDEESSQSLLESWAQGIKAMLANKFIEDPSLKEKIALNDLKDVSFEWPDLS